MAPELGFYRKLLVRGSASSALSRRQHGFESRWGCPEKS
jgi:hypothetical protein